MLPPRRRKRRAGAGIIDRAGLRRNPRVRAGLHSWRTAQQHNRRRISDSVGPVLVGWKPETARNVGQTVELPKHLPEIPSLDLAIHSRPLLEHSGDHYEICPTPSGRWLVLLADASGHGEAAAAEISVLSNLVRSQPRLAERPGDMLGYLNRRLAPRPCGAFITAFLAVYDPWSRRLEYASAGHPPPRLRRCRDGTTSSLDQVGGPPLGVAPDQHYIQAAKRLAPDDRIFLYTDGITETFNVDREMFGVERLDRSLHCGTDAVGLLDSAFHRIDKFLAGHAHRDDATLIALRVI